VSKFGRDLIKSMKQAARHAAGKPAHPRVTVSRRQSLKTMAALAALQASGASAQTGAKPKLRLVVLDIGGTLIPDKGEVPEAMKSALMKAGIEASYAEIGDWRGASKRGMIRHFVELRAPKTGTDLDKLTDRIFADFNAKADVAYKDVRPLPGIEEAMRAMRGQGLLLATSTGFGKELNATIFRRLKWGEQFAVSINSDDVVDGRPAPYMIFRAMEATHVENVAEVAIVGDTPLDLQAGNNSGVRGVIGVTSGAATEERLRRERYTQIIPSVAELPALLRSEF
jgi:phosphonatase-like hydrolase